MAEKLLNDLVVRHLTADINNSTTSVSLDDVTGLSASGNYRGKCDGELFKITSMSTGSGTTGTLTVATRGLAGTDDATSAASHPSGTAFQIVGTAAGDEQFVADQIAGASLTNGESVLAGDTTLAAASGVYEDTGLSVDLPEAGTYLISFCGRIYAASGGSATPALGVCKMVNVTDSADVANSESLVFDLAGLGASIPASTGIEFPTAFFKLITAAGAKTIKIQIQITVISGSLSSKHVFSDGNGRSRMSYTQTA